MSSEKRKEIKNYLLNFLIKKNEKNIAKKISKIVKLFLIHF
jgi:hypothetical protein